MVLTLEGARARGVAVAVLTFAAAAVASTIEVVFPTPMIDKRVGSTEPDSPLTMKPALKGEFQWISTRSGQFKLSEAPKFNASYDFALRQGLTDLAGRPLSTDQLASVNSAQFRVIDQSP